MLTTHGCPECYKVDELNTICGKQMRVLYEKQLKKGNELMQMGYKVFSIWGCQFQPSKDIEINNIIKCNNKYRMISNGKYVFKELIVWRTR